MLYIKSFFRKKTTMIYFILYNIMLISFIILMSFMNYYNEISMNKFIHNSYILVVSDNDYDDILDKSSNVVSYKKGITIKPNYNYDIVWDNLKINFPNAKDKIIAFFSNDVATNNIVIYYNKKEVIDLLNTKIGFLINDENYVFNVENAVNSNIVCINISDKFLSQLDKNNNLVYQIFVNNYSNSVSLVETLKSFSKDGDIVSIIQDGSYDESGGNYRLNNILSNLKYVFILLMIVDTIILSIIFENIIKDEERILNIYKNLGYKNYQLCSILFIYIFSLTIISFFTSYFIGNVVILILNNYFENLLF